MNAINQGAPQRTQRGITPGERMAGLAPDALRELNEVDAFIKANQLDDAEKTLARVAASAPQHPEVLRILGLVHHLRGRFGEAIVTLSDANNRRPNDPMILNHLGALLRERGKVDAGMRLMRRACELGPRLPTAWINLGTALEAEGHSEEGAAALERALELQPEHAQARLVYANSLRATGRIDDAIAQYRETIRRQPKSAQAWFSLLDLKTVSLGDDELASLQRLLADPALSRRDHAFAGFALGIALENAQQYDAAFRTFADANAIWRKTFRWDLAAYSALMDQFMAAFDAPVTAASNANLGKEVIFVVSLPRSGSTLAEQILGAHEQIDGAGELPDMPATIQEESNRRGESFPQWVAKCSAEDWQRLGERYLERTRKKHGRAPLFTDKSLANWPFMGAIAAMLPGARFVNCRRDPVETTWSCFKQLFPSSPHPFAYELGELGGYWREYDRVTKFWHAHLPGRVFDQVYEDLLAEPEAQIRQLLDFCAVPFDPACVEFHRSSRKVGTASAAQVRRPLLQDTARASNYGALLDPLRRALAGAVSPA